MQHFHPSDQAANVNWNDFAIYGMSQVQNASGPAALAATLQNLFQPLAPTIRVYPTGQQPPLPPELQPSQTNGLSVVQWYHYGTPVNVEGYTLERVAEPLVSGALPQTFPNPMFSFGYGATSGAVPSAWYTYSDAVAPDQYAFVVDSRNTYAGANTLRIQYFGSSNSEFAYASEYLDATPLQGKTLHLSGAIRTQDVAGTVDLQLQTFGPSGTTSQDLGAEMPSGTTGWQTYEVTLNVPSNATGIELNLFLNGASTVWFGNLSLPEGGEPMPVLDPAAPYYADLGGGVSCMVPLALYANGQETDGNHHIAGGDLLPLVVRHICEDELPFDPVPHDRRAIGCFSRQPVVVNHSHRRPQRGGRGGLDCRGSACRRCRTNQL